MADEADIGNERAEIMLSDLIAEARYQLTKPSNDWPYGEGRCKNCGDKLDDTRPYCDEPCRDDYWERIKSESRNGKYRGG